MQASALREHQHLMESRGMQVLLVEVEASGEGLRQLCYAQAPYVGHV